MEKYDILDSKKETVVKNNKTTYKYLIKIKCKDCGIIRWVNPSNKYYKSGICRKCNEIKYRNEVLKIENENFKVLSIDEEGTKKNTRHTRYFVQCKKCNKIFSRRASVIRNSLSSIQCSNCRHIRNGKTLDSTLYKMYCYYRSAAKKRNLEWGLTESQFYNLIKENCKYCNRKPEERNLHYGKDNSRKVNGIDRIDSNKGYTIDNCVPCCEICNRMKTNLDLNTFLNTIKNIYNFSIKSSTTILKGSTSQSNGGGSGELRHAE